MWNAFIAFLFAINLAQAAAEPVTVSKAARDSATVSAKADKPASDLKQKESQPRPGLTDSIPPKDALQTSPLSNTKSVSIPSPSPDTSMAKAPEADPLLAPAQPMDSAAALASPMDSAIKPPLPRDAPGTPFEVQPSLAPLPRPVFQDYTLIGKEYVFGIGGQVVAGTLGFFIGSAIETAIAGNEEAHKGTLSFTRGIRYDNFYGAFWGATTAGFLGSAMTVYFTGQSDEEDGGFFGTLLGTGAFGAGALYLAGVMGVHDHAGWWPMLPLLALPTAGGVVGFNVSRWFSDRKRESIMGPDAGIRLRLPTLAWLPDAQGGQTIDFKAINLSF